MMIGGDVEPGWSRRETGPPGLSCPMLLRSFPCFPGYSADAVHVCRCDLALWPTLQPYDFPFWPGRGVPAGAVPAPPLIGACINVIMIRCRQGAEGDPD